jgi:8-oxo-dGTP pyrophosphatase MutT (NUDIX family)
MSKQSPWTTHEHRVMYDNPWIRVTESRVTHPSGDPGIYGVVDMKHIATGVVVLDGDHTWLVGQWRYPLGQYSWEIPQGGAPHGEDAQTAAQRELREETGLEAAQWSHLGTVHLSNSVTNERGELYLAQDIRRAGRPEPEASEDLQAKRVPFQQALSMVDKGEITDAMTVLGLLRVAAPLRGVETTPYLTQVSSESSFDVQGQGAGTAEPGP